ncbi:MAG: hypothetical protein EU541_07315 [Promethearchaeota archaeon]|nr:MAG: hypothetical protein EU541_07315 [Candidatus Lokiarchaeota archaeon]
MTSPIKQKLEDLRQDNSSGARELIEKAIEIIEIYLEGFSKNNIDISIGLIKIASQIINSRPSMAPLINTIGFLMRGKDRITKGIILKRLKELSNYRTKQMTSLQTHFGSLLNRIYKPELKIMLISHSSTINTLFSKHTDKNIIFYVLESRPLLEGQKTAEYYSNNFQTNLIVDSAMGKFIEEIDMVLVGIDSILRDGSIINKIGTYPLSVLAFENNKKVFAIGDSFKYNLRSHFSQEIKIQKKPSNEIYKKSGQKNKLTIKNYYFDITPSKYITRIISDLGIHSPPKFLELVKKHLNFDWFNSYI